MKFEPGKSYPISTLPDDLMDESIPASQKWAIRGALFWNDCEGWWHEHIAGYWLRERWKDKQSARFWSPEPEQPMTRKELLDEMGMEACPVCDIAVDKGKQCVCERRKGESTK